MIYDFDKLNLPREYNIKQYKISSAKMRNSIIDGEYNSTPFLQFCSDYFSYNIIMINNEDTVRYHPLNNPSSRAPKLFLYEDLINDIYYQVMVDNQDYLIDSHKDFSFDKNPEEEKIEQIEEIPNEEPLYDCNKLLKMKVSELQEIAQKLNIDIQKMNPRKTRMINKKKDELISDLVNKN